MARKIIRFKKSQDEACAGHCQQQNFSAARVSQKMQTFSFQTFETLGCFVVLKTILIIALCQNSSYWNDSIKA